LTSRSKIPPHLGETFVDVLQDPQPFSFQHPASTYDESRLPRGKRLEMISVA
jgi:hypothetical protein